jgi:hypothetical protein
MRCMQASKIFDFTLSSAIAFAAVSTFWMRCVS